MESRYTNASSETLGGSVHSVSEDLLHDAKAHYEAMAVKYKQAEKGLDEFLSTLMHDIRSPLCSLKTSLDIADEDLEAGNYDKLRELLGTSNASTQRLLHFIDRLYANVRVGQTTPEFQELSLEELLLELKQDLFGQFRTTQSELIMESRLPMLRADPILLRQLFQNLILNSIKFRASERPLLIQIKSKALTDGAGHEITFSDNGQGFSEEDPNCLFDRYYKSKDYWNEGMGLGLATCKIITRKHRWSIRAEANKDVGAAFIITTQLSH